MERRPRPTAPRPRTSSLAAFRATSQGRPGAGSTPTKNQATTQIEVEPLDTFESMGAFPYPRMTTCRGRERVQTRRRQRKRPNASEAARVHATETTRPTRSLAGGGKEGPARQLHTGRRGMQRNDPTRQSAASICCYTNGGSLTHAKLQFVQPQPEQGQSYTTTQRRRTRTRQKTAPCKQAKRETIAPRTMMEAEQTET